jgi:hypothetical protein
MRSTNPKLVELPHMDQWTMNISAIRHAIDEADIVVCAWGNNVNDALRLCVLKLFGSHPLHHLGLTNQGEPRHPLYLRKDTKPVYWE